MDFHVTTGFGTTPHWKDLGLTADQVKELNSIGYTGKTSDGRKIDYQAYLNSLNDGHRYEVRCLRQNNAEATATFRVTRVDADEVAGIESFRITTALGKSSDWAALGLSEAQLKELNTIGYTGKSSAGERTTFSAYLNSIALGCRYEVTKTHRDTGDFMEKYLVKRLALTGSAPAEGPSAPANSEAVVAAPAAAARAYDNQDFPIAKTLGSAMVRKVRADGDTVTVDLVAFLNRGGDQESAEKTVALGRGQSMLLGTFEKRGKKFETHLQVDDSGRAGVEFRFQGWNKPLFVSDTAGVELSQGENGALRGTFYRTGTRLQLTASEVAGWRTEGNSLVREDGAKLTNVFRSLDGETYEASRLQFSCADRGTVELGQIGGTEYRIQVGGGNVAALSMTRWTEPAAERTGVLLRAADGYRVVEFGAIGSRTTALKLNPAEQAELDEAFAAGNVIFVGTKVAGAVDEDGVMTVVELELGSERARPDAPLWVVAQTNPELFQA